MFVQSERKKCSCVLPLPVTSAVWWWCCGSCGSWLLPVFLCMLYSYVVSVILLYNHRVGNRLCQKRLMLSSRSVYGPRVSCFLLRYEHGFDTTFPASRSVVRRVKTQSRRWSTLVAASSRRVSHLSRSYPVPCLLCTQ